MSESIKSRLGWNKLVGYAIPRHANNITYLLGGSVLVLGVLQGITGIILQQFYHVHVSPPSAYESLLDILGIPILSFVRNFHYWGSQVILTVVILHLVRVFIGGAYKRPREIQWLAGVGLFVLAYAWIFTGIVLKWDQEAVEALAHNIEVAEGIAALGYLSLPQLAHVPILTGLYSAHVTLIPAVVLIVLGLHLVLIRTLGISSPKLEVKENL